MDWDLLSRSVVSIDAFCDEEDGLVNQGSGTVVLDGDHVLTNHHVVTDEAGGVCDPIALWGMNSRGDELVLFAFGEVIPEALDPELDLAVIRLTYDKEGEPFKLSWRTPIEIVERELRLGEDLMLVGYPGAGGDTISLFEGIFSGLRDYDGDDNWSGEFYKTSATMQPGLSGGAAFRTETGEFVGVPSARVYLAEELGDYVGHIRPAKYAIPLLRAAARAD